MRFEEIVSKIESYRESLKRQEALIEVVDFGAGKPEEKRTQEQMEAGITLDIPLCELAKIGGKREKAEVIFKIFNDLS
ncbi:MAG: class I SAM-dependent methyltransferase, partial [Helicobacter sp.]|nr:class I SAM-dependent methyltransferase [Helicobacter sp.]